MTIPTPLSDLVPEATAHRTLDVQPLTQAGFSAFGDVIESEGHVALPINAGMTDRYDDLAGVDVAPQDGRPLISLFHARPYTLPLPITELERHPLGSQAFIPLDGQRFVVIVAPAGDAPQADTVRAFVTNGRQGVNYRRGVWHHSLIVVGQPSRFAVVDRGGPGPNCDVVPLAPGLELRTDAAI